MKCLEIDDREVEAIKREWKMLKGTHRIEENIPFITTLLKDICGELKQEGAQ